MPGHRGIATSERRFYEETGQQQITALYERLSRDDELNGDSNSIVKPKENA